MYNATFQIHLRKTWSILFKNFHLSFLKDISWWFYIAFGQQMLTFGQQNVDFRNLHEKLIYKVYFFHINEIEIFSKKKTKFCIICGKFARFPNFDFQIISKIYFQIWFPKFILEICSFYFQKVQPSVD